MDESQEHIMDPPVEVLDPSVLYFNEIYNYLLNKTLPEGSTLSHNKSIKRRSRQYCLKNGILFYGIKCPRKVIILKKDQRTLMENAHIKNQTDKHLNTKEMLEILSKNYYWKTMTSDINKFIKQCNQCIVQMSKSGSALSKNELLDPALSRVWREVELQLLGPYNPTLNQNEYIVALIDPATEWITARPLPRENLANRIAAFIYETFILIGFTKLHICGTTQILVEEIDKAFKEYLADLNDFLAHFIVDLNVLKVEKCETKCPWATDLILDFVSNSNSKWDEKLKHFVFAYCCTFTKNTIGSPFLRMFKRLPYNESEENAENISPQNSLNKQVLSNSVSKCTLCKMEFSNNHLLKIHLKTHKENSQNSSLHSQKKKLRENSRVQSTHKYELANDEEFVDDPGELSSDANILNENCNESRDKNQRKAKVRANSTFRTNMESSLPKNTEGSLPTGGLTRLEKLMALASKKDNIPIQPENTDVKTSTVAAVKEILESTKEERRYRGKYHKYSLETQEKMVKFAVENGSQSAAYHFSNLLGIPVSESTIRNIVKSFRSYSNISISLREEIAQYSLHFGSESAAKHYSEQLNRVIKRCHVRRFVQAYLHHNASNDPPLSTLDNLEKNSNSKISYSTELKEKIGEYASRTTIAETIEHFSKILPFLVRASAVRRFRKTYMDNHKGTLLSMPAEKQTVTETEPDVPTDNNNDTDHNNTQSMEIINQNTVNNYSQTEILNSTINEQTTSEHFHINFSNGTLNNSFDNFTTIQPDYIFSNNYNIPPINQEFSTVENNFLESSTNQNVIQNNHTILINNVINECEKKLPESQNSNNLYTLENCNPAYINTDTSYNNTITKPPTIENSEPPPPVEKKQLKGKKRNQSESSNEKEITNSPKAKKNKSSRGVYTVYTPELRLEMGRYAADHGNQQACLHFQKLLGVSVPESTIRGLRDKYLTKKQRGESELSALDYNTRGRPMRLGQYDEIVQECIKDLIKTGEKPSAFLVIATARHVLMQQNPSLLEENGGKIKLNISWAKSFLKRIGMHKNS